MFGLKWITKFLNLIITGLLFFLSFFLALFVQNCWSRSDVPGEDGSFLCVLLKGYEQDGNTLQNISKEQESRCYYLLGSLIYFWQRITIFFSISELPLLRYRLFVLATVSFSILLILFFFNKIILRHYQRGQEELARLAAVLFRLDHWWELMWDSKAMMSWFWCSAGH